MYFLKKLNPARSNSFGFGLLNGWHDLCKLLAFWVSAVNCVVPGDDAVSYFWKAVGTVTWCLDLIYDYWKNLFWVIQQ